MIQISKTKTYGFEQAIRGMRNPLNSWHKSDSYHGCAGIHCTDCNGEKCLGASYHFGLEDGKLAMNLADYTPDHRKFMRMMTVYADITAPLYWWKEYDTYKVGTVANSCSTMHTIHRKPFTPDDFSIGMMTGVSKTVMVKTVIPMLNSEREAFLATKDKRHWWNIIQMLPSSYNQLRTVMLNYQVLRNMYHARRNHKLMEWQVFCYWVETLPYSILITGVKEDADKA